MLVVDTETGWRSTVDEMLDSNKNIWLEHVENLIKIVSFYQNYNGKTVQLLLTL